MNLLDTIFVMLLETLGCLLLFFVLLYIVRYLFIYLSYKEETASGFLFYGEYSPRSVNSRMPSLLARLTLTHIDVDSVL